MHKAYSQSKQCPYAHTRTYAHAHARTHTHAHTRGHAAWQHAYLGATLLTGRRILSRVQVLRHFRLCTTRKKSGVGCYLKVGTNGRRLCAARKKHSCVEGDGVVTTRVRVCGVCVRVCLGCMCVWVWGVGGSGVR